MEIKILEVSQEGLMIKVTVDRGHGPDLFMVKNKMDLVEQLTWARACDSDFAALKNLEGTTLKL